TVRVGVGIVRARVVVGFPGAVILVADLPILEAVALGDVPVADPVGGLGGGARAVIGRDEHLRGGGGGDVGELVERSGPLPGVTAGGVRLPVILVRQRTAGDTERLVPPLRQRRNRCSGADERVPTGLVHTAAARVNPTDGRH